MVRIVSCLYFNFATKAKYTWLVWRHKHTSKSSAILKNCRIVKAAFPGRKVDFSNKKGYYRVFSDRLVNLENKHDMAGATKKQKVDEVLNEEVKL